jgi:hypothetical protein
MTVRKRLLYGASFGAVFLVLIGIGLFREEFYEIIMNASILCYSCVGIK